MTVLDSSTWRHSPARGRKALNWGLLLTLAVNVTIWVALVKTVAAVL